MKETLEPLIRALKQRDDLTSEEECLIRELPTYIRIFDRGNEIVAQNSRPEQSCFMFEGVSARGVELPDGTRQITGIHIAGDFVDLHSLVLKSMDHSVFAASSCTTVFVPHAALTRLITKSPHIGRLLWLATLIDAAIQRTWMSWMGRRSAISNLAHLACELLIRHQAVGLAENAIMKLPLSQIEIGDALGISAVHVNRVLQELRATGLISWKGQTVHILDFNGLAHLGGFDPGYLHLEKEPR